MPIDPCNSSAWTGAPLADCGRGSLRGEFPRTNARCVSETQDVKSTITAEAWTAGGEESPVADNSTEEGRQKNRRISLRVIEKAGSAA